HTAADATYWPVERANHVQQPPLQVGAREALVDGEALDLVEDRIARRRDRVAPVDAADRNHVDRRLVLLESVDLGRRGLRAQDVRLVEEERVSRGPRRMSRCECELVEVVFEGL